MSECSGEHRGSRQGSHTLGSRISIPSTQRVGTACMRTWITLVAFRFKKEDAMWSHVLTFAFPIPPSYCFHHCHFPSSILPPLHQIKTLHAMTTLPYKISMGLNYYTEEVGPITLVIGI